MCLKLVLTLSQACLQNEVMSMMHDAMEHRKPDDKVCIFAGPSFTWGSGWFNSTFGQYCIMKQQHRQWERHCQAVALMWWDWYSDTSKHSCNGIGIQGFVFWQKVVMLYFLRSEEKFNACIYRKTKFYSAGVHNHFSSSVNIYISKSLILFFREKNCRWY